MAQTLRQRFIHLLPANMRPAPIVPVVRLSGVIGYSSPVTSGFTLSSVSRTLERAFSVKDAKAVALVINSPGGSPVQSHLVHQRIRSLAAEHDKKVIAFVEDVAASGGYMIAAAADEIVADPNSIVGSIGVVSASFGFHQLIERIGIERRIYAAGERKVMLDPFQPEKPEEVKRLKAVQRDIHARFIELVKERRGKHLSGPEKTLFSGEFWVGGDAQKFGLVDQLGDLRGTLRERYGKKVDIRLISPPSGWFRRRVPGVSWDTRADWAGSLISALEARMLWSRYGL